MLVSVSSDQGGASKAALHHTPLDLVSLASQIQEVAMVQPSCNVTYCMI